MQYPSWKWPVNQFPFCRQFLGAILQDPVEVSSRFWSEQTRLIGFFPTSIKRSLTFPCLCKASQNNTLVEFTFTVWQGKEFLHPGTCHSLGQGNNFTIGQNQGNTHFPMTPGIQTMQLLEGWFSKWISSALFQCHEPGTESVHVFLTLFCQDLWKSVWKLKILDSRKTFPSSFYISF